MTPTWVHFDRRFGTPACSSGGYPFIRQGSRGNYVCIAQDDLNTLGFSTGGLDGIFGVKTYNAVVNYQRSRGLAADGITVVDDIYYIQRGYEELASKLRGIGAQIEKVTDEKELQKFILKVS